MKKIIINRFYNGLDCCLGYINFETKNYYTLEPPWIFNIKNYSCIPSGNYACSWDKDNKRGVFFHVENVPDRKNILGHIGNIIDDTSGCILIGDSLTTIKNKKSVLNSKISLGEIFEKMGFKIFEKFELEIRNIF